MSTTRATTMGTAVSVLVAALLAMGGLAWACTPQTKVLSAAPASGTAGTALTLRGNAVAPGQPVEIRWNGVRGQRVGQAVADADGEFVGQAVAPDVPPGVYFLVVVAGEDAGVGRMAFEVTSAEPAADTAAPAGDLWSSQAPSPASTAGGLAPGLVAGIALLGVGLVALFAGATVAAVNSRPSALAGSERRADTRSFSE